MELQSPLDARLNRLHLVLGRPNRCHSFDHLPMWLTINRSFVNVEFQILVNKHSFLSINYSKPGLYYSTLKKTYINFHNAIFFYFVILLLRIQVDRLMRIVVALVLTVAR
jgi:hypothetical protein